MHKKEIEKIKSFTDLKVWKKGHEFVLCIYKITKNFPKEELFGLSNQLRRASVSITSNVAEGFSRKTYKEKSRFYFIALGSLVEAQNQLLIARDTKYITPKEFNILAKRSIEISKMINGLIGSVRKVKYYI